MARHPKNVPTKARLSRELGISYYTLVTKYWNRPGRPKDNSPGSARYNVQAYRDWISPMKSAHNFGTGHSNGNGSNGHLPYNEREQSIIEKNRIAAMAARFDLDVKMGEYVHRLQVNRDIDTANAIVKRELVKLMQHVLPPKLQGLSAAEMSKIAMDELNRVLKFLPGHFEKAASGTG